jgi:hypothetical protein
LLAIFLPIKVAFSSYQEGMMIKTLIAVIATSAFALLAAGSATATPAIKHVFVIVMENTSDDQIYGQKNIAPYINNELIPNYAHALNFVDPLPPEVPSEPHYIWMEAGTNKLGGTIFNNDEDPSASNSTPSSDHLVARIKASNTFTWRTYQEGINSNTGECPIVSDLKYAAKHNPFVFFHDVSGNPLNKDEKVCKEHLLGVRRRFGGEQHGELRIYHPGFVQRHAWRQRFMPRRSESSDKSRRYLAVTRTAADHRLGQEQFRSHIHHMGRARQKLH